MPATYQSEMRKETTKEKREIAGELQDGRPKYLEIKSNLHRESPEIHISSNSSSIKTHPDEKCSHRTWYYGIIIPVL